MWEGGRRCGDETRKGKPTSPQNVGISSESSKVVLVHRFVDVYSERAPVSNNMIIFMVICLPTNVKRQQFYYISQTRNECMDTFQAAKI